MCRRNEVRSEERTSPGGNPVDSSGVHNHDCYKRLSRSTRIITSLHVDPVVNEIGNDRRSLLTVRKQTYVNGDVETTVDSATAASTNTRDISEHVRRERDDEAYADPRNSDDDDGPDDVALSVSSILLTVGEYSDDNIPARWYDCCYLDNCT